jgi:hypothetical protein
MPRGSTFSANPDQVIAIIAPNNTPVPIPYGPMPGNGLLPENFCLDTDTAGNAVFGYGIY